MIVATTTKGGKCRWQYRPASGSPGPLRKSEASAKADQERAEGGRR